MGAAKRDAGDLRRKVSDPGFTPAVRDAAALVALLDDDDDALVKSVERALARLGEPLVGLARDLAKKATPRARARLVRAAGVAIVKGESADGVAFLVDSLRDADARAVRYAASALGKTRAHAAVAEKALVAALGRAQTDDVRRAIADALGKVGGKSARDAVGAVESQDPELARIVGKAKLRIDRTAARAGETTTIDPAAAIERPVPLLFRCREGLESVLVEELGESWSPRAVDAGRVQAVLRGPIGKALVSRVAMSFAVLVEGHHASRDEAEAIIEALASDAAWRALRGFSRGPVRYRLAFEQGGHRRALVHRVAAEVSARRPELVNDPKESPWEALVVRRGDLVAIELSPRALPDARFDYRVADVPAASHPTIAAALARVAGVKDDDVVWDPFVGSALELIERAKLGPRRALFGYDVDDGALEAARANLARASVEATLRLADSTIAAPPGVTLAITNPPMGRRVARGALVTLVDRFCHQVAQSLAPGGRLVWLSPMPERSRTRLEEAGLTIDLAREVDMGGFSAELQRATKR